MRGAQCCAALVAMSALAGCPTVDLGDTPPDVGQCLPDATYFQNVIWPQYIAPADQSKSCVGRSGCHDSSNGSSALRLSTATPIDYSSNYQIVTRFLDCGTPSNSELLTKPLAGVDNHGGGDIFVNNSDPAVVAFLAWFPP